MKKTSLNLLGMENLPSGFWKYNSWKFYKKVVPGRYKLKENKK